MLNMKPLLEKLSETQNLNMLIVKTTLMGDTPKTYNPKQFDRPSVTVDIVVFSIQKNDLKVLLIKRGVWPFKDMWAIPGGFIKMNEGLEIAAKRELFQETNVKDVYMEQLYTFGAPKRDPRTRVITVSYFALINPEKIEKIQLKAATDAKEVKWFSVYSLPKLAFDHKEILNYALKRLRYKLEYSNAVLGLMPEKFTLTDLQKAYELILHKEIDKRNFRKKVLSMNVLKELKGEAMSEGAHRPAQLYSFKDKKIRILFSNPRFT